MPKRYTFYGAQELSALADTVYNEVKMANSVFPGNQHEAQLRRDLLKQNPEKLRWLDNSLEEWASLISEEAKLISGVKKSDKESALTDIRVLS